MVIGCGEPHNIEAAGAKTQGLSFAVTLSGGDDGTTRGDVGGRDLCWRITWGHARRDLGDILAWGEGALAWAAAAWPEGEFAHAA